MKKIFFIICFFAYLAPAIAQDTAKKYSFDLSMGITSRHIWRGLLLSDAVNVQPNATLTMGKLSLMGFSSYAIGKNYAEVDFLLTWSSNGLSIGLNNYCVLNEPQDTFKYFNFKSSTTPHILDACFSYQLPESFPLKLFASVLVWGNDLDEKNENRYSTYLELSYPVNISSTKLTLIAGGTMAKGLYADKANLVNVGCSAEKKLKITDTYSLPCTFTLSFSPDKEYVYIVFGLTL